MNDQTEVIVLSLTDYKEKDALVKVFSKDKGLLTFVARGLNAMESKNRMACLPYGLSEFLYDDHETKGLQNLKSAQSLELRYKIQEDLEKSSIASLVVELSELVLSSSVDTVDLERYFNYLNQFFHLLNHESKPKHLLAYALFNFLDTYGISPQVDGCVLCGSSQINSILIEEGGFICHECQHETQSPIYDVETLKDFRVIHKVNENNLMDYLQYREPKPVVLKILMDFLEFHTGHMPKAWEFIQKWSIMETL